MKKKIYKAFSVILAVIVAFSVCNCILGTIFADVEKTYYISKGAMGGDGTEGKPFATVTEAITAANATSISEGDTLNIVALGDVSWGATSTPAHKYNITVKSNGDAVALTIPNMTSLGGPTILDNINATVEGASGALFLYRQDFTLTKTASLTSPYFHFGRSTTTGDADDGQNVIINGSLNCSKRVVLGNDWNNCNYVGNINFVINDAAHSFNIYFGSSNGNASYAGVNIDVKAAAGVSFNSLKNGSALRYDFTNGYLQVINSSATVLDIDSGGLADIDDSKKLIINNSLGIKGLLSFTDTKGKIAVASGYENVKATSTSATINAVNNELTLTLGFVYSVTADKIPESKTYYVKKGSASGDGTKDLPYATVGEAVKYANDAGLIANDLLTVKLLGTDIIDWDAAPSHRFKLVVESDDSINKSTVIIPSGTTLGGDTEFRNMILNSTEFHSAVRYNFNDVIIGDGVTSDVRHLVVGGVTHSPEVDDVNLQLNFPFSGAQVMLGNEYSATNFAGDLNVGVNNAATKIKFTLTTNNGKNTYQNLNFDIKNAAEFSFAKTGTGSFEVKGALQLLNSSPNAINIDAGALADIDDGKKYIINNLSGDSSLLQFTDTIGKYKVDSEYDVYAVKAGTTDRILPVAGYLTLTAGEYTVKIERDAVIKEYYVSSGGISVATGTRPETAGTKENPVRTFADATRLISQDPLSTQDIAKIIIPADDVVNWGENPVNCAPLLKIQSSAEGVKATLTTTDNFDIVADTVFKDVIVETTGEYKILRMNNYNVTFDTGSEYTSPYICIGGGNGKVVDKDITLIFKGIFNPRSFEFTSNYGSSTFNGDINVIIDSNESVFAPVFGGAANTVTNYNGNINVTVLNAKTISLKKTVNLDKGATFNFGGSLQMIVDDSVEFPYAVKTNFNEFEVSGGKWYITNYAKEDDFVQFSDTRGKFNIKDSKTAFVRDVTSNQETKVTTGVVSLASGQYMISDKNTPKAVDDSHKMLHFSSAGNGRNQVYARFPATAGKTYVYELSYYAILADNTYPTICEDGNRPVLTEVTIISDKIVNNYHKVVCEFTVPEYYNASEYIFAGLQVGKSNEGVLFDQKIYEKGDATKTNVMTNNNFHYGLDEWALSMSFWGNHWSGERGGTGVLKFQIGVELLEVMNFDLDFIKELIASSNPQDGEWWNKKDIHEEVIYTAYTKAGGTFKDQSGHPISDAKFVLVSSDGYTYSATTNSNGRFNFGKIVVGFYELYLVNKSGEKIHTGYSAYLDEGNIFTFNVVSDMSGLSAEGDYTQDPNSGEDDGNNVEDAKIGSLSGGVYTPYLEPVANLKLYLGDFGEIVTDSNGAFAFANIPVGTYDLYSVMSNGEKYVLKTVTIVENAELALKLKYDPPIVAETDSANYGWIIWVVIAACVALLVVAAIIIILIVVKKKK